MSDAGDRVGLVNGGPGWPCAFVREGGATTDLGTFGGFTSAAWGINALGQVVGYAQTSSMDHHAFLYEGSGLQDLGTLGGAYSCAYALTDRGQVAGAAETPWGDLHPFCWS